MNHQHFSTHFAITGCVYTSVWVCVRDTEKETEGYQQEGNRQKEKCQEAQSENQTIRRQRRERGGKTTVRQSNEKKKEMEESVKERVGDGHKKDQVI